MGLLASLAGFTAGAALGGETATAEGRSQDPAPGMESTGSSASGPSFYVWDEDPEQARRWAKELAPPPVLKDDYFG